MSSSAARRQLSDSRYAAYFGVAAGIFVVTMLFGIALRVSMREDIDIVARAGISRVLDQGISDFWDTFLLLVIVHAAYLGALWALWKGFRRSFAAAMAAVVIAALAMLPAMPLTSPDAVHLAADVRTFWLHGKWPAEASGAPSTVDDPVANEVRVFRNNPSGYGPLAYAIGGAPLPFVGDGFKANLVGQKVVAGTFLVLTALVAGLIARRLGQNPGLVAALIGLNPMMIWQYPGDGHNDSLMAFFGVVAIGLVIHESWRWRAGGVAAGVASALCKYALLLASPVVAAYWWPKFRNALAALAAIGGAAVLFLYVIDAGPITNGTLGPAGAVVPTTPWGVVANIVDAGGSGQNRMIVASYMLFLIGLAAIMMYARLDEPIDLVRAVAITMGFFLFVCSPGYLAWYLIWFVPFAALSASRWIIAWMLAYSATAFLPILALNWQLSMRNAWNITNPVEWFVVAAWLITIAVVYGAWRGRDWSRFGRPAQNKAKGPRFAPRQKRATR